jgi:ubiquinone/menaquinone biosynthesis C-methylase UbiE
MLIDNCSDFFKHVSRCPISKERLRNNGSALVAECGFTYEQGDLRVGLEFARVWQENQQDYERYHAGWLHRTAAEYQLDDQELQEVYSAMEMAGAVLDVGGGPGLVAQQASLDTECFISVDAIPCRWADIAPTSAFASHYSKCSNLCRVPAFAEFLPIATGSMDCVHMRSCLDHFANPLLALKEAYRVLTPDGALIVGLSLEGAYKKGPSGTLQRLKIMVKETPWARDLYERFFDHHMFHPTRNNLRALLYQAGFRVDREVWQPSYHNVIYMRCVKSETYRGIVKTS